MKISLITLLLLMQFISFSQSIEVLDVKYGFKSIKLDDPISKFSNQISLIKTFSADNTSVYKFTPSDMNLYSVFNSKMDEIRLIFENSSNKLIGILLLKTYPPSNSNHYSDALDEASTLRENFIAMFGKGNSKISNNDASGDQLGIAWIGDKAALSVVTSYHGLSKGSDNQVAVFKTDYMKAKLNSGF